MLGMVVAGMFAVAPVTGGATLPTHQSLAHASQADAKVVFVADSGPVLLISAEAFADGNRSAEAPRLAPLESVVELGTDGLTLAPDGSVSVPSVIDRGAFTNTGTSTVIVTLATANGLQKYSLEPGFGILVGDPTLLGPTHRQGCVCTCTSANGHTRTITSDCPPPIEGDNCPCSSLNGQSCQIQAELFGTTSNCQRALIEN